MKRKSCAMQLLIFPKLTEVLVVKGINCLMVLPMSAKFTAYWGKFFARANKHKCL